MQLLFALLSFKCYCRVSNDPFTVHTLELFQPVNEGLNIFICYYKIVCSSEPPNPHQNQISPTTGHIGEVL